MMEENGMLETVSFIISGIITVSFIISGIISGAVESAEKAFVEFLENSDSAMLFW